MCRLILRGAAAVFFFTAALGFGQDLNPEPGLSSGSRWYLSNASGLALELIPSRIAALRNVYCLSAETISENEIPPSLLPFFKSEFSVELRTLYENGTASRRQWLFRDQRNVTRLNASGAARVQSGEGEAQPPAPESGVTETGETENHREINFIEVYDENHYIIEEYQFAADHDRLTGFTYSGGILVKAETWIKEPSPEAEAGITTPLPARASPPLMTDLYRYTRSASLRAIERVYSAGISDNAANRLAFPGIIPGLSDQSDLLKTGPDYNAVLPDETPVPVDTRTVFSTDSKGRVLSEKILDQEGAVWGELENTWAGDRVASVHWKSGDEERIIEYEYDSQGNRILEKNYNRGVLERIVRSEGDQEVEELYIGGKMMLRAVWQQGRKISEERIR